MDDERKDYIDVERPPQRNRLKQLQNHIVPTYDVENTKGTNKGENLRLANKQQIVFREEKGCRKGFRGTIELLHVDQHFLNESQTRLKNLAVACIDTKMHMIWSCKAGY